MNYEPAGFWIRAMAAIIDGLIMGVIGVLLMFVLEAPSINFEDSTTLDIFILIYSAVFIVIFTASKLKASPGKLILGIQVLTLDNKQIGIGRSIGRYFAYMISTFTLMIGYLMAGFTKDKKALHDLICGTRVVHKQK
ncbi:RDD family protein [Alkalihalobacillus sp. FSL W8-0930]